MEQTLVDVRVGSMVEWWVAMLGAKSVALMAEKWDVLSADMLVLPVAAWTVALMAARKAGQSSNWKEAQLESLKAETMAALKVCTKVVSLELCLGVSLVGMTDVWMV